MFARVEATGSSLRLRYSVTACLLGLGFLFPCGCAAPPHVKESSLAQLQLIKELRQAMQVIEDALAIVPTGNQELMTAVREVAAASVNPDTALSETSEIQHKGLAQALNPQRTEPATEGPATARNKVKWLEPLRLQVQVMEACSTVIHRYLAVDVFGNEEVEKTRQLLSKANEAVQ